VSRALKLPLLAPCLVLAVVDCEPSWQSFQSNCYRLVGEKKSWQDAKKTCLRSGGDLVSIHTLSELEFVTKQIKQGMESLGPAQGNIDILKRLHFAAPELVGLLLGQGFREVIPTGTGMGHPGEPGLNLAWEGSSTALGAAAGKEKRMEHGLRWEIPRAVSWAQSCSSSPFPGREVERQPLQPDPALHLQKARPGEPGERRG
uniref:C-type lectin domain-containing protein n=1 Tax=Anas platyrhynchos platyrhynchos TaxID=8840 RepID=A0A493U107_ANAPP